jgi:small neutral amino acid transporter SnatA (MarC family)
LTISTVMSRVVGILLAAIAIQTILNGLNNLDIINL